MINFRMQLGFSLPLILARAAWPGAPGFWV